MNILFVSQYFWPESFRGNDIAFELALRGHQVTVLTGKPNYPGGRFFNGYGFFHPREERFKGVRIIRTPLIPRGRGRGLSLLVNYSSFVIFSLFAVLFRLGRDYEAIFVQQLSPVFAALPGVWMKKRIGAPLVLWILDLWPESITAASNLNSPWLLKCVTHIVRYIYRAADVILMSSRSFGGSIRGNLADSAKEPEYFPNWAEDVFTSPQQHEVPFDVQFPPGFKVMFAGNVGAAQDFETVLRAAEQTRGSGICWLIVGGGRKLEWIQSQIGERALNNVFVLGNHPMELMPAFFRGADAMLLSLRDDPLFRLTVPAKLQAYMAAGKAIIGVLAGEGAEVLRASEGGIVVEPGHATALAAAALRLRDLPGVERQRMAACSRAYYQANFDRSTRIDRLEELLQQLSSRRDPRKTTTVGTSCPASP